MRKVLFWYLFIVLGIGLAAYTLWSPESTHASRIIAFCTDALKTAFLSGILFINAMIFSVEMPPTRRLVIISSVSIFMAGLAAILMYNWGPESPREPVLAGWGNDRSTYEPLPILGYQFVAICIFVVYFLTGGLLWFVSILPISISQD